MNNIGGNSIPTIKTPSVLKAPQISIGGGSIPTPKPPLVPKMKFTPDILKNSMKGLQSKDNPDFKYLKSFEKQAITGLALGRYLGKSLGKGILKGRKLWQWSKLHPLKATLGGTAVLGGSLILGKKRKKRKITIEI